MYKAFTKIYLDEHVLTHESFGRDRAQLWSLSGDVITAIVECMGYSNVELSHTEFSEEMIQTRIKENGTVICHAATNITEVK